MDESGACEVKLIANRPLIRSLLVLYRVIIANCLSVYSKRVCRHRCMASCVVVISVVVIVVVTVG